MVADFISDYVEISRSLIHDLEPRFRTAVSVHPGEVADYRLETEVRINSRPIRNIALQFESVRPILHSKHRLSDMDTTLHRRRILQAEQAECLGA